MTDTASVKIDRSYQIHRHQAVVHPDLTVSAACIAAERAAQSCAAEGRKALMVEVIIYVAPREAVAT